MADYLSYYFNGRVTGMNSKSESRPLYDLADVLYLQDPLDATNVTYVSY